LARKGSVWTVKPKVKKGIAKKATRLLTDSHCSGVKIFHRRTEQNPRSRGTYSGTSADATLYTSPQEIISPSSPLRLD